MDLKIQQIQQIQHTNTGSAIQPPLMGDNSTHCVRYIQYREQEEAGLVVEKPSSAVNLQRVCFRWKLEPLPPISVCLIGRLAVR